MAWPEGKAQPVGSRVATQDHVRQRLRRPVTLHDHLGPVFQRYLQQCRDRQGSGQAEPLEEHGGAGHQRKSPDHSLSLDCPHRRIRPPWPVIDPPEHRHLGTRADPVGCKHPAHDHYAQPGCGDKRVGPPSLVRPAVRGLGPPPGQPPAQVPCPAHLTGSCRGSRLVDCICRHRHHTCAAGSPRSRQNTVLFTRWLAGDAGIPFREIMIMSPKICLRLCTPIALVRLGCLHCPRHLADIVSSWR